MSVRPLSPLTPELALGTSTWTTLSPRKHVRLVAAASRQVQRLQAQAPDYELADDAHRIERVSIPQFFENRNSKRRIENNAQCVKLSNAAVMAQLPTAHSRL